MNYNAYGGGYGGPPPGYGGGRKSPPADDDDDDRQQKKCKYGSKCYNKDKDHIRQFHPERLKGKGNNWKDHFNDKNKGDDDDDDGGEGGKICPFDSKPEGCTRKNPDHFKEMRHPNKERKEKKGKGKDNPLAGANTDPWPQVPGGPGPWGQNPGAPSRWGPGGGPPGGGGPPPGGPAGGPPGGGGPPGSWGPGPSGAAGGNAPGQFLPAGPPGQPAWPPTGTVSIPSSLSTPVQRSGFFGEKAKLYHCTGEDAAFSILTNNAFLPSKKGMLGPGIYFAASVDAARYKAIGAGGHVVGNTRPVLECLVFLHRSLEVTGAHPQLNQDVCHALDCATVHGTGYKSGPEWVVYDAKQVKVLNVITK